MEKEIQARVDFKLDELVSSVKNRIKSNELLAFSSIMEINDARLSQKHTHYKEAFNQFLMMIEKERNMGIPSDSMHDLKRRDARDKAVSYIMGLSVINKLPRSTQQSILSSIVSAIEGAQIF